MIRKRNLDSSLIQWIMTVTGLGPGVGDLFWVAPTTASTSQFKSWMETGLGIGETIYATPTAAEDAMVAYRNDVMLVAPGAYDGTASIGWDKAQSHIIGLGGPNQWGDHSEPNVCIYTDSTQVNNVINITGQNCMFINVNFENYGAHGDNETAVKVNKYAAYFENCRMAGNMTTQQNADASCSSLWIAEAGMYPVFKNCQIGQDVWGARTTANAGVIEYRTTSGASAGRPNGSDFIGCRILSVGDDSNCAMVRIAAATAIGRGHRFDNCFFSHFASTGGGDAPLTRGFYMPSASVQKDIIHIHNCIAVGITRWQDEDDEVVWGSMPATATTGGVASELTGD